MTRIDSIFTDQIMTLKHADTTERILNAYYTVYNELGYGFLERVYENAMMFELTEMGLAAQNQAPVTVSYKNMAVGEYFADLLVEDKVIVELKAAEKLIDAHRFQLLNYLKATKLEVGLLLNFGLKPRQPNWGPLGYVTFKRTYARVVNDQDGNAPRNIGRPSAASSKAATPSSSTTAAASSCPGARQGPALRPGNVPAHVGLQVPAAGPRPVDDGHGLHLRSAAPPRSTTAPSSPPTTSTSISPAPSAS
jgi:GxxExxY protein